MRSFLDFLIGRKTAKAEPNGRLGLFGVESHGAQDMRRFRDTILVVVNRQK